MNHPVNQLSDIVDNGLRIRELSKLNSNEFNKKEELGIASRIKKI